MFVLCFQQSGRSWAGPAQRRGTRVPVSNIHENRQTTTVHLRQYNNGKQQKWWRWRLQQQSFYHTERTLFGAELCQTEQQRTGGGGGLVVFDSCDSESVLQSLVFPLAPSRNPLSPLALLLRASWRTEERMSLCKEGSSLFVLQ